MKQICVASPGSFCGITERAKSDSFIGGFALNVNLAVDRFVSVGGRYRVLLYD